MSDKERLENMSPIGFDLDGNVLLKGEDYHWLMERAEYVEELEKDLDEWRKEALRWLERFEESEESYLITKELLERVVNQNKRYREALEFYADKKSWMNRKVTILMDCEPTDVEDCPAIFDDGGNIARQALEGEGNA